MVAGPEDGDAGVARETRSVRIAVGHQEAFEASSAILGEFTNFREYVHAALSHFQSCVVMPKIRDKLWIDGILEGGTGDSGPGQIRDVHDVERRNRQ